ncbi:hypothetical protein KHA80_04650 [Anaerobacillus sp. HL2]|nr:hypothetical protein KHA80_04650 [Anaerobacillus sp. HL2]
MEKSGIFIFPMLLWDYYHFRHYSFNQGYYSLLRFTSLSEASFNWVVMALTFVALLVGGVCIWW